MIQPQHRQAKQQLHHRRNSCAENALNGERLGAAEQGKGGTAQQNRKDLVGTEFIHGIPPR
ncbi:MAG: hypothetical protein ACLTXT_06400 [Ruminococcus callidus]